MKRLPQRISSNSGNFIFREWLRADSAYPHKRKSANTFARGLLSGLFLFFGTAANRGAYIRGKAAVAYELVHVKSDADWLSYHAIRRDVLWEARGLTGYDDKRPEERLPNRYPLLLKLDNRAIGTTRLDDRGDDTGIVRLVAIRRDVQRQGHGRKLGAMVDEFAVKLGLHTLFVNAHAENEIPVPRAYRRKGRTEVSRTRLAGQHLLFCND